MLSCSHRFASLPHIALKFFDSFHPLNTILENDFVMVIREEVRPIRLSLGIVGF